MSFYGDRVRDTDRADGGYLPLRIPPDRLTGAQAELRRILSRRR